MLLIAYPQLNFWFHATTGTAWLRDEESSDLAVVFHSLTPQAVAAVPPATLERVHLEIAATYNNYGAGPEEKNLPAIPVSFIDRPEKTLPADLPEWFLAVAPEENASGTWIIHTREPVFALRYRDLGDDQLIAPGSTPGAALIREARRQTEQLLSPDPAHFH